MDFGFYPPEINSGRMYSGPGSGPMLAAAQAWIALADELYTAAGGYQSVVSELTSGAWSGPSSASMSAAAASFVEWLSATAAQAEESATQAQAAAAGYETAFAMTVPPPVIAANRSLLAALVATNFFGQNTPAIAATEIQYAEMWAQDAVAMYGYAASSASATPCHRSSSRSRTPIPGRRRARPPRSARPPTPPPAMRKARFRLRSKLFPRCPTRLQSLTTSQSAATGTAAADPLNTVEQSDHDLRLVPSDLALFAAVIPVGIAAGPVDLPFAIVDSRPVSTPTSIVSGWNGEDPFIRQRRYPLERLPGDHPQPEPERRDRDRGGHARMRKRSAGCRSRRAGPSPHRR